MPKYNHKSLIDDNVLNLLGFLPTRTEGGSVWVRKPFTVNGQFNILLYNSLGNEFCQLQASGNFKKVTTVESLNWLGSDDFKVTLDGDQVMVYKGKLPDDKMGFGRSIESAIKDFNK